MTAGAFLTFEPLIKVFGQHEVKNKAAIFRKTYPEFVSTKGKSDLSVYEAAYYLYIFSATTSNREIATKDLGIKMYTSAHAQNKLVQDSILTYLGGQISASGSHKQELTGKLSHLTISKKTGIMNAFFGDGKKISFPDELTKDSQVKLAQYTLYGDEVIILTRDFFVELGTAFKK